MEPSAPLFECHETTITWEHDLDEVTVYTTREDVYEALLARSNAPRRHKALQPGYEIIYRSSDLVDLLQVVKERDVELEKKREREEQRTKKRDKRRW